MLVPGIVIALSGQTPKTFEVASLKPNKSGDPGEFAEFLSGGQVTVRNMSMKELLEGAYHVGNGQIEGPAWIGGDRFDIAAKGKPGDSPDDLRVEMQSLLAERFRMALHKETRSLPVFVLEVSKRGPRMKKSPPAPEGDDRCVPGKGNPGDRHLECSHITMEELSKHLQLLARGYVDRQVLDETRLKGSFQFHLDWTPAGIYYGTKSTTNDATAPDAYSGYSLFDALERQLGLTMKRANRQLPVIVIDHMERTPLEN